MHFDFQLSSLFMDHAITALCAVFKVKRMTNSAFPKCALLICPRTFVYLIEANDIRFAVIGISFSVGTYGFKS